MGGDEERGLKAMAALMKRPDFSADPDPKYRPPELRAETIMADRDPRELPIDLPLDMLLKRRLLAGDDDLARAMHQEGWNFAKGAWAVFGAPPSCAGPWKRMVRAEEAARGEPSETWLKRQRTEHEARLAVLADAPGACKAIESICQHLEKPRWIWMRVDGIAELEAMRAGLKRLVATVDLRNRRVAATLRETAVSPAASAEARRVLKS